MNTRGRKANPHEAADAARRALLRAALAAPLAFASGRTARATGATSAPAPEPPIADAHSHLAARRGTRRDAPSLRAAMTEAGVTLLAWTISADGPWIRRTPQGIFQVAEPAPGQQAQHFARALDAWDAAVEREALAVARTPDDLDAAARGRPTVVLASEGAGFLEGSAAALAAAHARGLRHLQLVHYIRNDLADFQTERPVHGGLTALGREVVLEAGRLGVLVDLAHATPAAVDQALDTGIAAPCVWSHSSVSNGRHDWRSPPRLARLLPLAQARRIAAGGGAIGLWALGSTVGRGPSGYADEIARLVDLLGVEHVMFGSDTDGLGSDAAIESLGDLRRVVDALMTRGLDADTVRAVAFGNYARCLAAAIRGAAAGSVDGRAGSGSGR